MSNCPNCNCELLIEHSFCPNCGHDLRAREISKTGVEGQTESSILNEPIKQMENVLVKSDFKKPFILALSFSAISIFIWSYVYTNWIFDFNVFLRRLINHSFWILLLPYLISLFFKKVKRVRVYSNMVFLFTVVGTIFLFIGYLLVKVNEDPFIVRDKLKRPCIDEIIKKLNDVNASDEIKNMRATKYCDCIMEKINDNELKLINNGEKKLRDAITKEENKECVLVSLEND